MKHLPYLIPFLIFLLLFLQGCITHKAAFPGTAWEKPSPAESGFDAAKLTALTSYIENSSNTTGLVVLHDGKVVYEYGDIEQVSYIASCRKSVLSMLYGKYVDQGLIDLNQDIGSLGIDEKDGLLPKEKEATIDHIIISKVFPNIHNRVPQHMIASYLGITPVHLSRLKKQDTSKT